MRAVMRFIFVALISVTAACAATQWYGDDSYYFPSNNVVAVDHHKATRKGTFCYEQLGVTFQHYKGQCPPADVVREQTIAFLRRIGADGPDRLAGTTVTFTPYKIHCATFQKAEGCWSQLGSITVQLAKGIGWWGETLCHEYMHEMLFQISPYFPAVGPNDNHTDADLQAAQAYVAIDDYMLVKTKWHGKFGNGRVWLFDDDED